MVISVCFTKHCFLINKNKIPIVKVNNCCYKTNLLYESKKNKTEEHRGTKKRKIFFLTKGKMVMMTANGFKFYSLLTSIN